MAESRIWKLRRARRGVEEEEFPPTPHVWGRGVVVVWMSKLCTVVRDEELQARSHMVTSECG